MYSRKLLKKKLLVLFIIGFSFKIENIRRDHAIKKNKTKIQRITERLRRAQQDLKIILKK